MTASSPQTALLAGRYRLEEKLGEGGMAVVHSAFDEHSGTRVALKQLLSRATEKRSLVSLFEREFYTLKSLAHPNIVSALDYGRVTEGTPFYTMELLSGGSATESAPMPWQRAAAVVRDVASALSLLHSRRLVHRDVTSRNIHCCEEGSVKLIDFGALAPMGVAGDIVGTPPFTPPEALDQRALDQRTDLYSLGAAAYHLLTGTHAYPARSMAMLHRVWRSAPRRPSAVVDLPPELDDLVMSLLDLDPDGRPAHAGVVVARLTAIAKLPPVRTAAAARSFLTTPRLVGRQEPVGEIRRRIGELRERRGGVVVVRGAPGVGRSRMLDAIALEAQVLGATVVRADSRDARSEAELLEALTRALDQVLPDPDGAANAERGAALPAMKRIRRAVHRHSLVVLLDDLERFEPPALALLPTLAHMTDGHPVLLVATHVVPAPEGLVDALDVLAPRSTVIELEPLSAEETSQLVSSYFHGASQLGAVSSFCHAVSAGRPATISALVRHLADQRIARFDGSTWQVPASLDGYDLPASAEQFLAKRIEQLDEDARTWGVLLSIIDTATPLTLRECVELMADRMPPDRSYRAMAALIAEHLASDAPELPRVGQAQVRSTFCDAVAPDTMREIHFAIARYLKSIDTPAALCAAAHHMLHADRLEDCLRLMRAGSARALDERASEKELERKFRPLGRWGDSFAVALRRAERQELPLLDLYPLYHATISMAVLTDPRLLEYGKPLFDHLCRDVGLDLYSESELDALAAGSPPKKLVTLFRLGRAAIRRLRTPKERRGLPPVKALQLLGRYVTSALGVANSVQAFHTDVPPLVRAIAPYRTLSPALGVVYDLLVGTCDAGRGLETGWSRLQRVLTRLREPVEGINEISRTGTLHILQYLEALECRAPMGDAACLEIARELEGADGFQTHAWQVRMQYHSYMGDAIAADRCRRELETRALASARDDLSIIAGLKSVAEVQASSGNIVGLQSTLQSIESAARRFPGWRGQLYVYRGEQALLLGDLEAARAHLRQAMSFAVAGECSSWAKAIPPYLDALLRLGRLDDARDAADAAFEETRRVAVAPVYRRRIEAMVALVWATTGEPEHARAMLDRLHAEARALGIRGITMAALEETCARAALATGDSESFDRAAERLARVFANHDAPTLAARYRRLMYDASRAGLQVHESRPAPAVGGDPDSVEQVRARIDHAAAGDRFRRALALLVERSGALGGHLFAFVGERAERVASVGEMTTQTTGLEGFVRALREADEGSTMTLTATGGAAELHWTSDTGVTYQPAILATADGQPRYVAMLERGESPLQPVSPRLFRSILEVLTSDAETLHLRRTAPPGPS